MVKGTKSGRENRRAEIGGGERVGSEKERKRDKSRRGQ